MEEIKRCVNCGRFLGESSFHWQNKEKGSRRNICKRCKKIYDKEYCERNRDGRKEYDRNHKDRRKENDQKNKDRIKKQQKEYRRNNREKIKKYGKRYNNRYRIKNRDKMRAKEVRRRARKVNAIPNNVDMKKVNYMYSFCNKLNKIHGYIKYHVDHIKPLSKGGLHHENNLQILEAKLNLEKSSSYPFEKKFEGIMYKNIKTS